jgi:insulysin
MNWPVPPERLISGPQLVWEWNTAEEDGNEEATIRRYLDHFRISEGRVVLMAKGEEHNKVRTGLKWEKEPWYDTKYNVERFDESFVDQVRLEGVRLSF